MQYKATKTLTEGWKCAQYLKYDDNYRVFILNTDNQTILVLSSRQL